MSQTTSSDSELSPDKSGIAALDGIFQAVNKSDAPGLVVGIARGGRPLYRRGFGLASIELGVANTAWTRMRIGSTSKHFTCLAALLLVEEGKLDINAGVRTYLPELPPLKGEPTLRQFMTHTSGYRCYLDAGFLSDGLAIKPKGIALGVQTRQSDVNFAPGEMMLYNNGGYHMLSLVIERVSGVPFERFLEERIFKPMAMFDTKSVPSDFEIHPNMATLHVAQPDGNWRRGIFPTEEVRGEGAMISTVDDMLRWLAHLRTPDTVGTDETWRQMTTPAILADGAVSTYALGLMVHDYRGVRVIHHAGGVIGGACQMITVPAHELDIIIMTNGAPVNPTELAYKVIDALLGDEVLGQREERASIDRFKSLLGKRYYSPSTGFVCCFADAGGKFGLSILNGAPIPLRDEGEALRIGFEDSAMGPFKFVTTDLADQPEPPASIAMSESGCLRTLELLPDVLPPLAGAALKGRYHSPDLGAEATITAEDDKLKLRIFGAFAINELDIEPVTAEVFNVAHPSHPQLRMVLTANPQKEAIRGFRIDSGRTRNMRFHRVDV